MRSRQQKLMVWPFLGIIWCATVWLTYIWANTGYYTEKLTAFVGYALRLLGINQ